MPSWTLEMGPIPVSLARIVREHPAVVELTRRWSTGAQRIS
jgi:hypothetical protein